MEINKSLPSYNKNTICRICMQDDDNLFPIFNEVFFGDDTITIAKIITECTKYPVAHNDRSINCFVSMMDQTEIVFFEIFRKICIVFAIISLYLEFF